MSAATLIARIENVPFSRWHAKARIVVGSATFFDAFDALSLAFALPVLINSWHITPNQTGLLISSSYAGQFIGALVFSALAERFGRIRSAAGATALMSIPLEAVTPELLRKNPELEAQLTFDSV